jgi:general secretion pathway protein L
MPMSSQSRAPWNKEFFDTALARAVGRLWEAYKREFFGLFLPEMLEWLLERGDRKIVLGIGEGARRLRFQDGAPEERASPIEPLELQGASLDEALARRGVARAEAKVSLEIPSDAFFVRRFDIPVAAEANLAKVLMADIERKTPFRAADVVYGHVAARRPEAPEKCAVQLWILRRDIVTRAIEGTGLDWNDLDFVTPFSTADGREEGPSVPLGRRREPSHWFRNLAIGLAALTVLLTALGLGTTIWRQDTAAKELDANIAAVTARAANVRKTADQAIAQSRLLQSLREERASGPSFADLWEEVSRILPDGAYLTEFRLSDSKGGERFLDLVGFAESAVGLPVLFDKSPMLSDAALTAAITPNAQEKREAFSLRAKVKLQNAAEQK